MTERCPACKGAKQVMRLGMIYRDCENCVGTGRIKKREELIIPSVTEPTHELLKEGIEPVRIDSENSKESSKTTTKAHKGMVTHGKERKGS